MNQEKPHAAVQRLPHELAQWLKHKAVDNRRSLNSEILHRLEQSRKAEEAQHEKQAVSMANSVSDRHSQEGAQ